MKYVALEHRHEGYTNEGSWTYVLGVFDTENECADAITEHGIEHPDVYHSIVAGDNTGPFTEVPATPLAKALKTLLKGTSYE